MTKLKLPAGNAICCSGCREGQNPSKQTYPTLAEIGEDGRALLPAFERRMARPLSPELKKIMAHSVATMRLPTVHREQFLARLAKVPEAESKR